MKRKKWKSIFTNEFVVQIIPNKKRNADNKKRNADNEKKKRL